MGRWPHIFNTGGAIRPDKSFIYPISFTWDNNGNYKFTSLDEITTQFTVKDHNNQRQELPRIDPSKGKETLGVHIAPNGNNMDQLQVMKDKVEKWCEKIKVGHLPA